MYNDFVMMKCRSITSILIHICFAKMLSIFTNDQRNNSILLCINKISKLINTIIQFHNVFDKFLRIDRHTKSI